MNPESVKEYINQSPFRDWYLKQGVLMQFQQYKSELSLKNISELYVFADMQFNEWSSFDRKLPPEFEKNKDYYLRLRQQIETLFSNVETENDLTIKWRQTNEFIINTLRNEKPFIFNHPITQFLINVFESSANEFNGAYRYFMDDVRNIWNNPNWIKGFFKALKYEQDLSSPNIQDQSITEYISNLEKTSNEYISKSENHLSEYINKTSEKYTEYFENLNASNNTLIHDFNKWAEESISNFNQFNENSQKKINDLETAYGELLKLSKPVAYWKERAVVLKKNANAFLCMLGALLFIGGFAIYYLLWHTPNDMLVSIFNGDKSSAVRWSIVFIIFISILFYGVKTLMKIAFSSLHLARDAEERERLTYVYLALIKDSAIDKEDRQMVMQSLFSRAETGLLKEDSGPTMPSSFIEKINKY